MATSVAIPVEGILYAFTICIWHLHSTSRLRSSNRPRQLSLKIACSHTMPYIIHVYTCMHRHRIHVINLQYNDKIYITKPSYNDIVVPLSSSVIFSLLLAACNNNNNSLHVTERRGGYGDRHHTLSGLLVSWSPLCSSSSGSSSSLSLGGLGCSSWYWLKSCNPGA